MNEKLFRPKKEERREERTNGQTEINHLALTTATLKKILEGEDTWNEIKRECRERLLYFVPLPNLLPGEEFIFALPF